MFASCSLSGMDFAMPDVCLTPAPPAPPIPIPYPNTAQRPMAVGFVPKVLVSMMPAHNLGTSIPVSMGDNAGVAGGAMSGLFMGPARNMMGSVKVISGGMPATTSFKPTMQNSTNCPGNGMTMVPSQFKVMILT